MKRQPARVLTGATLASLLGIGLNLLPLGTRAAFATNFGSVCDNSIDCVSLANNYDHAIRFANLTSADSAADSNGIPRMQAAVNHAIGVYDATDMRVYRNESDSLPDVWAHDWDYGPTGWAGITRCPSNNTGTGGTHPNRWCRGQYIIHNSYYYWHAAGNFDTDAQRQRVSCHEMGHTVGLRHNSDRNSCMSTPASTAFTQGLTAHDIAHINAKY
jgi:predicted Zn-dependent protease